jgi:hypothetical protein
VTRTRSIDRDYILAEIRRTAAGNGGAPLGKIRFLQSTGIKPSDWEGRYWLRWGDALAEAGFERNELNQAYEEEFLLERLASLVAKLGHFPLSTELRMAGRIDPGFPSRNVFTVRFGNKGQLAAKLLAFCQSKPDLRRVADLCRPHASKQPADGPSRAPVFGAVYLLRCGKFYKIGHSNAVGRRERELAIQLPERAEVLHEIRTDDPAGIEAYWHGRFASKRMNGEWFRLSADDLTAFKRRRFM